MNNKANTNQPQKRIAAVDILIILLLVLCLAGVAVRIAIGENGLFSREEKGSYAVSYIIEGEKDEYSSCFSEGCEFFLESGDRFGTLSGNATFTPAKILSENSRGEAVISYATDGTVDITGTFIVDGTMTESGFLLNSNTYIAPNMTVTVQSTDIIARITVTDITKAP
ncbi:MAG: hypothetical protein IJA52_00225 [Clostridia bacterium]|nr:hypothetical protein [Clostridia bacterium]